MTTRTAFLVHRPVMDCEESLDPYFICSTREEAESAAKQMCDYAEQLCKQMPEYMEEEEEVDKDSSVFCERAARRTELFEKAEWPFGVNLRSDFEGFYRLTFDPSCVRVMELPLI